jgi:hypothetical protein
MESGSSGDDDVESTEHRKRITELLGRIPEGKKGETWLERADVAASIGFAWGELVVYDEAVKWLEKALRAETGDCPVRALEQMVNFRVRDACEQWQRARKTSAAPQEELRRQLIDRIEGAIEDLGIARRRPTKERLDLLGSAWKRLAWVREPGEQSVWRPWSKRLTGTMRSRRNFPSRIRRSHESRLTSATLRRRVSPTRNPHP